MDTLQKAQIIQQLRECKDPEIYFEHVVSGTAHYDRICFVTDEDIYYVIANIDDMEFEWEGFNGSTHYDWKKDKSFLKDQFWANLDWLNVIEP